MKRLSVRLSIIGVLMASGILAIAQAQRGSEPGELPAGDDTPLVENVGPGPEAGLAVVPHPVTDTLAPAGMTPSGPPPAPENYQGYADPQYQPAAPGAPGYATASAQYTAPYAPPAPDYAPPVDNSLPVDVTAPPRATTATQLVDIDPAAGAMPPLPDVNLPGGGVPPLEPEIPGAHTLPPDRVQQELNDQGPPMVEQPGLAPQNVVGQPAPLAPENSVVGPDAGYGPYGAPAADYSQGYQRQSIAESTQPPAVEPGYAVDPGLPPVNPELPPVNHELPPVSPGPAPGGAQFADVPRESGMRGGPSLELQDAPLARGGAEFADSSPSLREPHEIGSAAAGGALIGNPIAPVAASEADDVRSAPTPGDRQLEGPQTPFVSIEKRAPREIRVGQPATFEIVVRNAGQVAAQDVTVIDQIPQGTQFLDATPKPHQTPQGMLIWSFGAIEPGQDKVVSLRLMPQQEGEIGSVAKVVCQAQASVRTNCTRPELQLKQTAPQQVLVGDELQVLIEVTNPGTGAAENVVLEADVPAGLTHRTGREIDYLVGTLQPKETRSVRLHLMAEQAGRVAHAVRAHAGNLVADDAIQIEVIAPNLQTKILGPSKRYLRREASFELELANPGTATARDIQAVVYLPQGLEFKTASHQGRYQPQNHAIFWRLEELPKGQSGKVQFATLPVSAGEQALRAEARGNLNTAARAEHNLAVESLNELVFTVNDVNDPIEVGSETMYEIRVTNNGSKTDADIEVIAQLPEGMRLVNADGPTKHQVDGAVVAFAPLARLAPNGDAVYRLAVQGGAAGDHRLRVQIRSQESPTPVIKEEVTRVYNDR